MTSKTLKARIVREGSACFIPLDFDPKEVFGKVRAPVVVTINGYTYRSTIAAMGGSACIPLRKSNREGARLEGGEMVNVRVDLDTEERRITPPADLMRALKEVPGASDRWQKLSYTHQREHVEAIEEAKKPETRARRIAAAIKLLQAGVIAVAMVVTSATAGAQQPTLAQSREAIAIERRVDSLFTSQIRPDGPGCAVGIYRKGEMVHSRGYGLASIEGGRPITPRTTFALGSVSKPFTALAALVLEQQGKLSLDDDVRRWVPELPDYGSPIRIRDLIQHTSGLRDYSALGVLSGRPETTMADFLGLMAAQRAVNFVPGTQHEYSHSDYVLLALVVERVVRMPFGEYLEREVLRPMGMKGSFVNDDRARSTQDRAFGHFVSTAGTRIQFPGSQIVGGGNIYASVEDLARWDHNFDQPVVGDRAVIARMLELPWLASGDTIPYAYGLRLGRYRGLRTIARGGHTGGTRAEIIRFPDQAFTVAALCNADKLEAGKLAQGVADLYLGSLMRPIPSRPTQPVAVAVSLEELKRYVGVYASADEPWNVLPIEIRNGQLGEVLFNDATDDTLFTMTPAGGGRFFEIGLTGNVGVFTFRSTAPGAPPSLEISWNGGPADVLHRVEDSELWRPESGALSEYKGIWFSEELDAGWRFDVRGERLVLIRSGQHDLSLRPIERDQFVRGFGSWEDEFIAQLRFHRDAAGKLTHLTVSTPSGEDSARDVRFVRVDG